MSQHSTNRLSLRSARRSGRRRGQCGQRILSGKCKDEMMVEYRERVRRKYEELYRRGDGNSGG